MNTRKIKGIVKIATSKVGELQLRNVNPNASDKEIRDFLSLYARVLPESFVWKDRLEEVSEIAFGDSKEAPTTRKTEVSHRTPTPIFKKGSEPAQGTLLRTVLLAVRSVPLATLTLIRSRYFGISNKPITKRNSVEVSVMLTKLIKLEYKD